MNCPLTQYGASSFHCDIDSKKRLEVIKLEAGNKHYFIIY